MKATKYRRADGHLRPTVVRRRRRLLQERLAAMTPEQRAEFNAKQEARWEWLRNFASGARVRFFKHSTAPTEAVWLRAFAESLGLPQDEAAPLLERLANERHWMKLRTLSGMVVGIAPPKPKEPKP